MKLQNSYHNIISTCLPPPPPALPHTHALKLHNLTNTFLWGDFSAHTQDPEGELLINQLHLLSIPYLRNQPTRLPTHQLQHPTLPDTTSCTPILHTRTNWHTVHEFSSDHLPILMTCHLTHPTHTTDDKTHKLQKNSAASICTIHIFQTPKLSQRQFPSPRPCHLPFQQYHGPCQQKTHIWA